MNSYELKMIGHSWEFRNYKIVCELVRIHLNYAAFVSSRHHQAPVPNIVNSYELLTYLIILRNPYELQRVVVSYDEFCGIPLGLLGIPWSHCGITKEFSMEILWKY